MNDPSHVLATIERLNQAVNDHDVPAIMATFAPDCVFENTAPAPDGSRYAGRKAVQAFWQDFFRASPQAHFDYEEYILAGERCTVRWTYHWIDAAGLPGHVRGVDVFRVRDGLIVEKLSYVKG
jgi:ketosteroid isomerase-like protein